MLMRNKRLQSLCNFFYGYILSPRWSWICYTKGRSNQPPPCELTCVLSDFASWKRIFHMLYIQRASPRNAPLWCGSSTLLSCWMCCHRLCRHGSFQLVDEDERAWHDCPNLCCYSSWNHTPHKSKICSCNTSLPSQNRLCSDWHAWQLLGTIGHISNKHACTPPSSQPRRSACAERTWQVSHATQDRRMGRHSLWSSGLSPGRLDSDDAQPQCVVFCLRCSSILYHTPHTDELLSFLFSLTYSFLLVLGFQHAS